MTILPSPDDPPPAPGRRVEPWRPPGLAAFPDPPRVRDVDVFGALLADSRAANTRQARVYDLVTLAHYLGLPGGREAAGLLISGTAGQAAAVALGFRGHMIDLGLASSTINRRLATLRRLVKLARRLGAIDWTLEAEGLPEERYRETAGPGDDGWRKILAVAEERARSGSAKGARDLAQIRLMHDSGLRISEVVAIDKADIDLAGSRVAIVGKGRRSREWVTINAPTALALAAWLEFLPPTPGPAFVRVSKPRATGEWSGAAGGGVPGRMVSRGVHRAVAELGKAAGVACRPHGLRHSGATRLLDLTDGDVRAVQRWTRHSDVRTVLIYDDNRRDLAGELADKLGDDAPGEGP